MSARALSALCMRWECARVPLTLSVPRSGIAHEPRWFREEFDTELGEQTWRYRGGYWEAKSARAWRDCPDIF